MSDAAGAVDGVLRSAAARAVKVGRSPRRLTQSSTANPRRYEYLKAVKHPRTP
jgi:hypothetical protein